MLFTRCPDCDTTFRVSDETLAKANGQVRCGRCASVFNAYAELREPPAEPPSKGESAPRGDQEIEPPRPEREATRPTAPARPAPTTTRTAAASDDVDRISVADVVAQVAIGEDAIDTADRETVDATNSITAAEVEQVLEALDTSAITAASFRLDGKRPAQHGKFWAVATGLAVATLGVQAVNHFRAELIVEPGIGPPLAKVYASLGITIVPHWSLKQYQILDWVANAEPNAHGQGSLKISARIHNRGPRAQPYPSVRLRLKDRWEEAVGSRVFAPSEYLDDASLATKLMPPGETAHAKLEVVDPGPDAYGFELDVCVEIETDVLSCGTDEVFL
jgi:predicted Zn finger-like uncharacterized protein